MRRSVTRTIAIHAPAPRVLDSLARPENLPDWRRAMLKERERRESGGEPIPVGMIGGLVDAPVWIDTDSNRGTIDYFWKTSEGIEVASARVISIDGGAHVVLTFFEPPPECKDCVSLEERAAAAEMDLQLLKALLEQAPHLSIDAWH